MTGCHANIVLTTVTHSSSAKNFFLYVFRFSIFFFLSFLTNLIEFLINLTFYKSSRRIRGRSSGRDDNSGSFVCLFVSFGILLYFVLVCVPVFSIFIGIFLIYVFLKFSLFFIHVPGFIDGRSRKRL